MITKKILILNSRLTTYKFEDGERTYNRVTFAFRDELADKDTIGFNEILSCSLNPNSFDVTKSIQPNELVEATLNLKRAENNTFKYVLSQIKGIEV